VTAHYWQSEAAKRRDASAALCNWQPASFELFRDVLMLMRDTGMRNERELYRIRVEHIDWFRQVIFVPDSKTPTGRREVPISIE
jgi:integrase